MIYKYIYFDDIGAHVQYSSFISNNGIDELNVIINLSPAVEHFELQRNRICQAIKHIVGLDDFIGASVVCKRFFVSDAVNQAPLLNDTGDCAVSVIQQPPLNGTKIAAWLYFVKNVSVQKKGNTIFFEHNNYMHLWNLSMKISEGDSYNQTNALLQQYSQILNEFDANIKDNCLRTWFYVRDVDIQYMPMVVARREFFERHGMTKDTHFIASTGICGVPDSPKAIIQMGAYAVKGLKEGQQTYIKALSHLNPTHEYGVTFERGTSVHYGDRNHIIISGTASINNKGEVVHVNDVEKQTLRMWDNVDALLNEAGASFNDLMHIVVYLRDPADFQRVKEMFEEKFPQIPGVITLAPVCRPNWLIEMECMAITHAHNKEFHDF